MFRIAIMVLAAIGLGTLLFGDAAGLAVGAGWLLLAPLFIILKIMFFLFIIGMFKYAFGHGRRRPERGPWGWRPVPPRRSDEPTRSAAELEDWHRLQHAREEVDRWVDGDIE